MKRFLLCLFLVLFVLSPFGWAQDDKDSVYFHAGQWDVPRAKWAAFADYFEKYEKAVLEKLVADGVLVEWGFESNSLHSPDGYSHGIWMGAKSMSDIDKALKTFYTAQGDNAEKVEAELAALITKHSDTITKAHFYAASTAKFSGGYLVGSSYKVKYGRQSDYLKAWEAWAKPVYEKLLADGVIVGYSLETEAYHTGELGEITAWTILKDMADDEKVEAAFDSAWESLSEVDRKARRTYWRDMTAEGHHKDYLEQIIHYQSK